MSVLIIATFSRTSDGGARPRHHACDGRVPQRELERRGFERHAVRAANRRQSIAFFDHGARRLLVVVVLAAGEDAAVVRSPEQDRDPPILAHSGREHRGRTLIEERVASCEQEAVDVDAFARTRRASPTGSCRRRWRSRDPPRACAPSRERRARWLGRSDRLGSWSNAMSIRSISESLQARFERPADGAGGEIEDGVVIERVTVGVVVDGAVRGHEHTPDFRRQREVVARESLEHAPEAKLAGAVAVEGGGVVVANTDVVRGPNTAPVADASSTLSKSPPSGAPPKPSRVTRSPVWPISAVASGFTETPRGFARVRRRGSPARWRRARSRGLESGTFGARG